MDVVSGMTVVHDDNFIPGTPSALCIYETVHGRVQLCAPVLNYSFPRETAFLLFLSPSLPYRTRGGLLFPRLSSFLFFYLHFFRMYNLAKRKSGRLVGEIFWRFFEQNHFFDFSRESSPSNNGFLG